MAKFICIDGIDGTGKTTQISRLAQWLEMSGNRVAITKEPGGTDVGGLIRSILLNKNTKLQPETEMLLFCADRAEHQHKIRSTLQSGINVICDRFLPSTWAYQIFGRKLSADILEDVTKHIVHTSPQLTIILDLDVTIALQRSLNRLRSSGKELDEGRFEAENEEFFRDVQKGFRWYAAENRFGKTVLLDANCTEDELFIKIKQVVEPLFR